MFHNLKKAFWSEDLHPKMFETGFVEKHNIFVYVWIIFCMSFIKTKLVVVFTLIN